MVATKAVKTSASIAKRVKPRIKRILAKKEPQLIENTKKLLTLRGKHTSQTICDILKDFGLLSKPNLVAFNRKNDILPFEDVNSLEFLMTKNDCSLVALGSHSKKRPDNLILGRSYDGHILDLIEFGCQNYSSVESFPGTKKLIASKPLFAFLGDQWESDITFSKLQNFLLDFFRGDKIDKLSLKGVDHVIVCAVIEGVVSLRVFNVSFMKSGSRIPTVKLDPMGPFLDMTIRRTQFASDDLMKLACRLPAGIKKAKVKNVKESSLGEKIGRIHMKKQDLDKMGGKRVTALRSFKKRPSTVNSTSEVEDNTSRKSKRSRSF